MIFKKSAFCICFFVFFAGCSLWEEPAKPLPKFALVKLDESEYPLFSDDLNYDKLESAIAWSIKYLKRLPKNRKFKFAEDDFSRQDMIDSLNNFQLFVNKRPRRDKLSRFIKENFFVYKSVGKSDKVLFTGYYEPELKGSLTKNGEYKYPVYSRPDDLIMVDLSLFSKKYKGKKIVARYENKKVLPYYNRDEIEKKKKMNAKPIAWLKDRIDLFFLQIQGSGKIFFDNGEYINVHYNCSNGRPYRSIGKYLIDKGKIPKKEMSMQRINSYLKDNPDEVDDILNYNPSYVFFNIEKQGPLGCYNVPLTPARSIATERRLFPAGALAFIKTSKPVIERDGNIDSWIDFSRFVLNQDTGGAIKGPGRVDLFCGNGASAKVAAGHMQHMGTLYFLIHK